MTRITITEIPPPDDFQIHPCLRGLHRWAWVVDGSQACGYCGRPR